MSGTNVGMVRPRRATATGSIAKQAEGAQKHRILFYSHDSFGLGHFRRSLTIASYLTRHIDSLSTLMLTGLDAPASFESFAGSDFVKLPSIWKSGPDAYRSRHLRVSFSRVRRMRKNLIRGVVRAFDPNILVVDNVPRGAEGELLPTLRYLREHRPRTRIVLTLRDVLDAPEQIVPKWRSLDVYDVLKNFYDEIWVAGCREVFDVLRLYEFPPSLHRRVKFCGYVVRSGGPENLAILRRQLRLPRSPLVVVSCGGGGDGYPLIDAYLGAAQHMSRDGIRSVVFLGPDMPIEHRRSLQQRSLALGDDMLMLDFHPDLVSVLSLADVAVSMGGYNTVCELLASGKPALVVPRMTPRVEQLLRADAFARYGMLDVLRPEALSPATLGEAVTRLLDGRNGKRGDAPAGFDFGGLRRMLRRTRKLLPAGGA